MDHKATYTILQCAINTDGQVGRSGMVKLLLGQDSKKLAKLKLDHLDEYGSLSYMGKANVLEHIDDLIERGCLAVSTFFFPMIQVTEVGRARMKTLVQLHGLRVLPEPAVDPEVERQVDDAYVCDEKEFWKIFLQDMNGGKYEVIIVSPFVSQRRANTMLKDFELLLKRGVTIKVYTRPVGDHEHRSQSVLDTLEGMGVSISLRRGIHSKAAIIDREIAWEGSLNILQHWNTREQMTRHEDPGYVNRLIEVLSVQ